MVRLSSWGTVAIAGLSCGAILAATNAPGEETATTDRVVLSRSLPEMKGGNLKITVLEVTYAPAAASQAHSHPCPVIGYVIEGAFRTQVRGEKEVVYTAGQSFYEAANGAHVVSANASADKPVRFLAYFTCDRETPLMLPVADSARAARP